MVALAGSDGDPVEDFLNNAKGEYEQVQRELQEIDLLIRQTSAEVDQLARRNVRVVSRMRQVESTFDTAPREDIREVYTTGLDTQQRLFTMRGHLEKLQSDKENLSRYSTMLRTVLQMSNVLNYEPEAEVSEDNSEQSLIIRTIETQERERQRLSRQMHDGPAQSLTNLILQAEICERLFDVDSERARAELGALKESVGATFQKVKGFILNLRPMMLDDLGLVPTMRRYVDSYCDNTGVLATLTVTGQERRFEPHKEVVVFRAVQELLNDAYEYDHATSVEIALDISGGAVRVSMDHNGSELDPGEDSDASREHRLERSTMRDRIEMLGGRISFDSGGVGEGTRANLELPIS